MLLLGKPVGHTASMVVIYISRAVCVYIMGHSLYLALWFPRAFDVIA